MAEESERSNRVLDMVDVRNNSVDRATTGRWRAASFLIGYETCERVAFYSILSNLVVYLSTELGEGIVVATRNVSNWNGTVWITPLFGAYVADTYLGRFRTITIFAIVYMLGMICLTLSVSLPVFTTTSTEVSTSSSREHTSFFFFSLYLVCIGAGGTKPNVSTLGAEQFEPHEGFLKQSFFNWWTFSICIGAVVAQTLLVYVQDNVGWGWGYGISSISFFIATSIFICGTPFYRHNIINPNSNPLSQIAQVIVASLSKWNTSFPKEEEGYLVFHELDTKSYVTNGRFPLTRTPKLRFLDKASIKKNKGSGEEGPWRLCTVTQVEETKMVLEIIPIWLVSLLFSTINSNTFTLFVKQGAIMDRRLNSHFEIPPASLGCLPALSMIILLPLYDRFLVPILSRFTKKERGISILQRMSVGIFIQIPTMAIAALVERHRLLVSKAHLNPYNPSISIPTSITWLLPQYILIGVSETFTSVAILEFFYDQVPTNMKSIGTAIYTTNVGVGWFLSSFLVTVIHKMTQNREHISWLEDNLNLAHLDYYYWFLMLLLIVNAGAFVFVSKKFTYKNMSENKSIIEI